MDKNPTDQKVIESNNLINVVEKKKVIFRKLDKI